MGADEPLVDDLAGVLMGEVAAWNRGIGYDLAEAPEVKRVMARYRADLDARPPAETDE